jgi:hypothetical protein
MFFFYGVDQPKMAAALAALLALERQSVTPLGDTRLWKAGTAPLPDSTFSPNRRTI